ncbi:hypothetical protein BTVI_00013 [Pitangus sulphuratus]|nr:hypothetical protein BTVI_00013 [Pitangus sulphuratus]
MRRVRKARWAMGKEGPQVNDDGEDDNEDEGSSWCLSEEGCEGDGDGEDEEEDEEEDVKDSDEGGGDDEGSL